MDGHLMLKEIAEGYSVKSQKVIIACVDRDILKYFFSNWEWLNLGLIVSEHLLKLPKEARKEEIVDIVRKIIEVTDSENVVIENIDVLFSPEYSLDVIKLFTLAGKNKRLIILWEGTFKNGILTYAEPGYDDYHSYEIKNYDAYCITK
ncbi:MAG: BREX-3 system P-loop-containing protein BrxF [Firmicutes bacterium]|nr:BREX-3 system P-loop-containing protein BrxF [Bacillota bacterium]